jgi:hypothetical protein
MIEPRWHCDANQNVAARSTAILAKATAAAAVARQARKASNLRTDFLDEPHWVDLAREAGFRLPVWGTPCTPGAMTRWLKRCGLSVAWYREATGFTSLRQHITANPRWPLRAWAGLCLEEWEALR